MLAKLAAMSMSKFTVAFKIHTGLSASSYIRRLRMDKAVELLKNTSCPLGEIASAVGYKRHASFSAAFREQFGIVPTVFRKHGGGGKNDAPCKNHSDIVPALIVEQ